MITVSCSVKCQLKPQMGLFRFSIHLASLGSTMELKDITSHPSAWQKLMTCGDKKATVMMIDSYVTQRYPA
jgi:hypothetical protein